MRFNFRRFVAVLLCAAVVAEAALSPISISSHTYSTSLFQTEALAARPAKLAQAVAGALFYNQKTRAQQKDNSIGNKRIVEVTAELALPPALLDRLETHLAKKGMTSPDIQKARRKAAMASSMGGIGPLLRERFLALLGLGANVNAVSLLYSYVYVQKQVVIRHTDGRVEHKLELVKEEIGSLIKEILEPVGEIRLQMYDGTETYVKVWRNPNHSFGKGKNAYFIEPVGLQDVMDGRADVLYTGEVDAPHAVNAKAAEVEARLAQQWVLGRGTLALMKHLRHKPDLIVMSEAASMMAHPKLFRDDLPEDPYFKDTLTVFNDHTPLDYAHPLWDEATLQKMHVDPRVWSVNQFWKWKDPTKMDQRVCDMTALIINSSDGVFGVAAKHGQHMREMDTLQSFAAKITHITNGVSAKFWPRRPVEDFANANDAYLLAYKDENRHKGLQWLVEREKERRGRYIDEDWLGRVKDKMLIVWDRRLVEYKRLQRLTEMLADKVQRDAFMETDSVIVFGGRCHPDDPYGPQEYTKIMALLDLHPELKDRIVFFENHNVDEAQPLFQMADASIMLSDEWQEAAATGFMKVQLNGGWVIATRDGAIPESVHFRGEHSKPNGFLIPYVPGKDDKGRDIMTPTSEGLLQAIQQASTVFKNPKKRAQMIRNAFASAPQVSVERTAKDMLNYFAGLLKTADAKKAQTMKGQQLAEACVRTELFTPPQAHYLLNFLNRPHLQSFEWKYEMGHNGEVRHIFHGHAGLHGLLRDFESLRALGTIGQWSLAYHAAQASNGGDLRKYVQALFEGTDIELPEDSEVLMSFLESLEDHLGTIAAHYLPLEDSDPEDTVRLRIEESVRYGAGVATIIHATPHNLEVGDTARFEAIVDLKGLTPHLMKAEVLVGRQESASEWRDMSWSYLGNGHYKVQTRHTLEEPGTYRSTIRISPRNTSLWPTGMDLDRATRTTLSEERIQVAISDRALAANGNKTGAILQIHALAYGARRRKDGSVAPGTAAHLLGQLPRILREGWSAIHLYALLPTGTLATHISKDIHENSEHPYFVKLEEGGRRWFTWQAAPGHKDRIGSKFAMSDPTGIDPEWGTLQQFGDVRNAIHNAGGRLYVDFSPNQTGLDDPWITKDKNWEAFMHVTIGEKLYGEAYEKFKHMSDEDLYNRRALYDILGHEAAQGLESACADINIGLGNEVDYSIFYRVPGDRASRILIAHGKDPNFTPWIDTAAYDLSNPVARERLFQIANTWADRGAHLRIDMSNLAIRNNFMKQWKKHVNREDWQHLDYIWGYSGDFWTEFWERVMLPHDHSNFTVILEAYGESELNYLNDFAKARNVPDQTPRISILEKAPYDNAAHSKPASAIQDLLSGLPTPHSVTFMQNLDEDGPWGRGIAFMRMWISLLTFAGGEYMVHYRQLKGEGYLPIQYLLSDRNPHLNNEEAKAFREYQLDKIKLHGTPVVQKIQKNTNGHDTPHLVTMWREVNGQKLLHVTNPTNGRQEASIRLPDHWLPKEGDSLVFEEKDGSKETSSVYIRSRADLADGLHVDLREPGEVQLFVVYPIPLNFNKKPKDHHRKYHRRRARAA